MSDTLDIKNASVQQHAVNMTFECVSSLGDPIDGMDIWVPDGHLYIIDNFVLTNYTSGAALCSVYWWGNWGSTSSYETAQNNFLGDDATTMAGRGAIEGLQMWRDNFGAYESLRPFGDSPYYLNGGQGLNIFAPAVGTIVASFSFRDCF